MKQFSPAVFLSRIYYYVTEVGSNCTNSVRKRTEEPLNGKSHRKYPPFLVALSTIVSKTRTFIFHDRKPIDLTLDFMRRSSYSRANLDFLFFSGEQK